MIKVFYGENIVLSRKLLTDEIEKSKAKKIEVIVLEGKSLTPNSLTQALESSSLFGQDRLIIIENFFSLPKSSQKEKLLEILLVNCDKQAFIWEGRDLTPATVKNYSVKFTFKPFKLSSGLFTFLDNLKPSQIKSNLTNLHWCLALEDVEMVYSMLIRQIRLLILAKEGEKYLNLLAPWQKSKILNQARLFELEKLKSLYPKLLKIDYQQKTSQILQDLRFSLDLLITEI